MSWFWIVCVAAGAFLVALALILWFLWKVYEKGGADDLRVAVVAVLQVVKAIAGIPLQVIKHLKAPLSTAARALGKAKKAWGQFRAIWKELEQMTESVQTSRDEVPGEETP
jgi:hypothetical protein